MRIIKCVYITCFLIFIMGISVSAEDNLFNSKYYYSGREYSIVLNVSKDNEEFNSIGDAVLFAEKYCTEKNRVLIKIGPGEYYESIILLGNPGIDMVGAGIEETFIVSDASYPNAALFTTGEGYFEDISFKSIVNDTYAVHIEAITNPKSGTISFVNCRFFGSNHAALGAGLGNGITLYFDGCEFVSDFNGVCSFYLHNHPLEYGIEYVIAKNCEFINYGGIATIVVHNVNHLAYPDNYAESQMFLSFENCYVDNNVMFEDKYGCFDYLPTNGDIQLLESSQGNNIEGLNFEYCSYLD